MKKLLKKLKEGENAERFSRLLAERMKSNNPISENPMIDGMIIGFILTTQPADQLFRQEHMGNVLDGTRQKLEQIIIWCSNNEDKLCSMLHYAFIA